MPEPSQPEAKNRKYEAFVFLPTIVEPPGGTEAILRKLAAALSGIAPESVGAVELKPADDFPFGPGGAEKAKRWTLRGSSSQQPVYDVIEVDYRPDLRLRDQGRAVKLLRIALASWWLAGSLLHAAFAIHRKTLWQRLQVVYIAAFTLALGVYLFLIAEEIVTALIHQFAHAENLKLTERLPNAAAARDALLAAVGACSIVGRILAQMPAFISAHGSVFGGLLVAGAVALAVFAVPKARHGLEAQFDDVRCWIACRRIAMIPLRPHVRRRFLLATRWLIALALLGAASTTATWWWPALVVAAVTSWLVAGFALRWVLENTPQILAVMTLLGIPIFASGTAFGAAMDLVVAGIDYGRIGTLRADITGRLLEVLRTAMRREGYTRVHVLAHAFGAIVALDTLFYTTGTGRTGALDASELERIGDLVTIAPPITFVQQLFPRHFDRIAGYFPTPQNHQWINVCSPLDILGTPILDEPFDVQHWYSWRTESWWAARVRSSMQHAALDADLNPGDPNNIFFGRKRNIDFTGWYPLNLQWFEMLSLAATRAHDWYWNAEGKADFNAFARIVPLLETDRAFAARAPVPQPAAVAAQVAPARGLAAAVRGLGELVRSFRHPRHAAGAAPNGELLPSATVALPSTPGALSDSVGLRSGMGWEPPRNSLWLRGGGIRDGSPIPRGAYPQRGEMRPCRPLPVVEYYCTGGGDLVLVHDILWPRWVGVPVQQSVKAEIKYADGCSAVKWAPARTDATGDNVVPPVGEWRPHLHRITITSASSRDHGCLMLRCERAECFMEPLTVGMELYHHKQEDPRSA